MRDKTTRSPIGLMLLTLTCLAATCLAVTSPAYADGKVFRHYSVADDPTITTQRALVVFRDGVETMIVESSADYEGQQAGWLIPVPSRPTLVRAASPGVLDTLDRWFQPRVIGDDKGWSMLRWGAGALWFLGLFGVWNWSQGEPRSPGIKRTCEVLIYITIGVALLSALLPSLGTIGSRSSSAAPIEAENLGRIGNYDVTVIDDDRADTVLDWLEQHEFISDEPSRQIITKYVAEGWSFVAANLSSDQTGTRLTPHPIEITFAADAPIYPMRLTGVTDEPLELDLYVMADDFASVDGMSSWSGARLVRATESFFEDIVDAYEPEFVSNTRAQPILQTTTGGIGLGHPRLVQLGWVRCAITRLHARLDPSDMTQDFAIELHQRKPARASVASPIAAWGISAGWALIAVAVGVLVGGAVLRYRVGVRRETIAMWIIGGLTLAGGGAGIGRAMFEVVPVNEGGRRSLFFGRLTQTYCRAIVEFIPQEYIGPSQRQIVLAIRDEILDEEVMPEIGDGPACMLVTLTERGLLLTLFNHIAMLYAVLLDPETGEIIEYDVEVWNTIARGEHVSWFVDTPKTDPSQDGS